MSKHVPILSTKTGSGLLIIYNVEAMTYMDENAFFNLTF